MPLVGPPFMLQEAYNSPLDSFLKHSEEPAMPSCPLCVPRDLAMSLGDRSSSLGALILKASGPKPSEGKSKIKPLGPCCDVAWSRV